MNKKDWIIIISIFVLTLTIGGVFLNFFPTFPVSGDSEIYDNIALNLVQGKGFRFEDNPTAIVAPGYPFFLAFSYAIFGHNYTAVRIIQFLFLAGIGTIIYFMAKNYFNLSSLFSLSASIIVIFWPYLVLYSTLILTEILFIFFLLLSIYFFFRFKEKPSFVNLFLSAGFLGMTVLIRPLLFLLPFWIFFILFFLKKWQKEFSFSKTFLFLLFFLLMLTPWTVRNYLQFHEFIPVTPEFKAILNRAFFHLDYTQSSQPVQSGEVNLKKILLARFKNIYLFWNPGAGGEKTQILIEKYPWTNNLFLIYKILFFIILALAFLSFRFIKHEKVFLLWIVIFYFWILHTVLYPYPRYTLPIVPLVIILAVFSFSYLSSQYKKKYISH